MTTLTVAEMLDAIQKAVTQIDAPDDAFTVDDLMGATGWNNARVRRTPKVAKAQGRLQVVRVQRETIAGVQRPIPGYVLLPPKKAKRGR